MALQRSNHRRVALACFVLPALVLGCAAPPVQQHEPVPTTAPADPYRERIDALAKPFIDGQYIVGMSVGVITPDGQATYHYGATAHGGPAPDDDTLYEIGSITKTMTGLLLADGVTRGLYELDTPANQLLGAQARLDPGVTLRRLATHTAGLPRMPSNHLALNLLDPYADYGEAKLLALLAQPSMIAEPGTKASYSNLGVGLLGYALARHEQTRYPVLLQERVLGPLGMRNTTIALSDAQALNLAQAHDGQGQPVRPWNLNVLAGAGGVRSTVRDMLTYARAQIEPSATPLHDAILLSQQPQSEPGGPTLGEQMGLGWFFTRGGKQLVHGGQTGGYHCFIGVTPASGSAVVVLTNTSNPIGSKFASRVVQLLAGEPIEPIELHTPAEVPTELLNGYAGRYTMEDGRTFEITHRNGRLSAQLAGQPRLRVYAVDQDTFRYRAVDATLDFERDAQGDVTGLILYQDGRTFRCPRVTSDR